MKPNINKLKNKFLEFKNKILNTHNFLVIETAYDTAYLINPTSGWMKHEYMSHVKLRKHLENKNYGIKIYSYQINLHYKIIRCQTCEWEFPLYKSECGLERIEWNLYKYYRNGLLKSCGEYLLDTVMK